MYWRVAWRLGLIQNSEGLFKRKQKMEQILVRKGRRLEWEMKCINFICYKFPKVLICQSELCVDDEVRLFESWHRKVKEKRLRGFWSVFYCLESVLPNEPREGWSRVTFLYSDLLPLELSVYDYQRMAHVSASHAPLSQSRKDLQLWLWQNRGLVMRWKGNIWLQWHLMVSCYMIRGDTTHRPKSLVGGWWYHLSKSSLEIPRPPGCRRYVSNKSTSYWNSSSSCNAPQLASLIDLWSGTKS